MQYNSVFNHAEWKQNFLRIKKLVLIGGPDDGVITPWQSRLISSVSHVLLNCGESVAVTCLLCLLSYSQFGFYDDNETVVEMKNQDVSGLFTVKCLLSCYFGPMQFLTSRWRCFSVSLGPGRL